MSRVSPRWGMLCCLILSIAVEAAPCRAQDGASPGPGTASNEGRPFALGLGYVFHPLQNKCLSLTEQAQALPACQRDRVHFLMINGFDPFYLGNLNGLAAYYRSVGFVNTECWQFPLTCEVGKRIKEIRQHCPEARIVLLGFSAGANCARSLAQKLNGEGIFLDCLIYLGGDTLTDCPKSCPANVGRILNITGDGFIPLGYNLFVNGVDLSCATNRRLNVRHILLPSRTEAIALIGQELLALAGGSPERAPVPPTGDQPSVAPAPAPLPAPVPTAFRLVRRSEEQLVRRSEEQPVPPPTFGQPTATETVGDDE